MTNGHRTLNQFERQNQPAIVDVADVEESQEVTEQCQSQNLKEFICYFSLSNCYFSKFAVRKRAILSKSTVQSVAQILFTYPGMSILFNIIQTIEVGRDLRDVVDHAGYAEQGGGTAKVLISE